MSIELTILINLCLHESWRNKGYRVVKVVSFDDRVEVHFVRPVPSNFRNEIKVRLYEFVGYSLNLERSMWNIREDVWIVPKF